ncbi:nucleotide sugar dehydrogenase [Asticcacaulis benevestitus]|uniref:UDP-glucose/GDP-mannose dehydrogenase C-terminal domain-containing protein n=1 Tax=Asticcacaulis benevestitus DSM 16100 = ATCC BAA-896 TaxID=1121022 RepID=V4PB91_9CAUL|nr:nucleotide sugar dehydrogenase [Asticcacaulis benevestitus]ESQ91127.1 hypothetical protein ABENE_10745 [Asticcacaulis benevestitus DSM 16100 = ATCC BAA-896]
MRVANTYPDRHVCVIGLGYVGLTLAVALAEVGFQVHGVELNPKTVEVIQSGRAPFKETGLDLRLAAQVSAGNLTASLDWPAPGTSNVYIVTVGTPLGAGEKITNLTSIRHVAERLSENLRPNNLILLRSTVRVGVSRDIVKAALDTSGLPYDLAFCPERTLEGKALHELRTLPQIIGGLTPASTMRASQFFNFLTPTTIRVRDLETAEMIKLINNTQRDLMFAFANEVAEMCDAIGVSALEVIEAGNMGYPRASMPIPGPVGGPCLEKDPYILAEGVTARGGEVRMPLLGREVNEALPSRTAKIVFDELLERGPSEKIQKGVIMGVAFKGRPETSDLRGTLAIPLIKELKTVFPDVKLVAYDPSVPDSDVESLGVEVSSSASEAFEGASFVIYQNNNVIFQSLDLSALSQSLAPGAIIYDMWNQYDSEMLHLRDDTVYFGLGTRILASISGTAGLADTKS